ncbi:hypothetical protein V5O48_005448 [Marasmius crinis-equi]|uniref:DUF6534 domain-containing protein n=1 Tax=Marasmius crinis-equi TaxID=585013 RepID=A0ABR3FMB3_9AGAR
MASGPPSVATIYGPLFIGTFISTILYGVTVVQTFIYLQRCKSDFRWIKYLVCYLFLAETVSAGLFFGIVYEPLVLKAGNPEIQVRSPLLLRADGPITVLISTPVQLFMAWRIKVISGSRLLAAIIAVLSLASLSGGIYLGFAVARKPNFVQFVEFREGPSIWLVTSAVADVLVAVSLVWSLIQKKNQSRFSTTNDHLEKLIRITVQTGTITAVAALADAIVFLTVPNTFNFKPQLSLSLPTSQPISSEGGDFELEETDSKAAGGVNRDEAVRVTFSSPSPGQTV